jgi:hypothetical protein
LQFEVNGQIYLLNFVPEAGRWFLFEPNGSSVAAIPVIDDDAPTPDRRTAIN